MHVNYVSIKLGGKAAFWGQAWRTKRSEHNERAERDILQVKGSLGNREKKGFRKGIQWLREVGLKLRGGERNGSISIEFLRVYKAPRYGTATSCHCSKQFIPSSVQIEQKLHHFDFQLVSPLFFKGWNYLSLLQTSSNCKKDSKQMPSPGLQTACLPFVGFRNCHFWIFFVRNSSHNNVGSGTSGGPPAELWDHLCLQGREENASNPTQAPLWMHSCIWKWANPWTPPGKPTLHPGYCKLGSTSNGKAVFLNLSAHD